MKISKRQLNTAATAAQKNHPMRFVGGLYAPHPLLHMGWSAWKVKASEVPLSISFVRIIALNETVLSYRGARLHRCHTPACLHCNAFPSSCTCTALHKYAPTACVSLCLCAQPVQTPAFTLHGRITWANCATCC